MASNITLVQGWEDSPVINEHLENPGVRQVKHRLSSLGFNSGEYEVCLVENNGEEYHVLSFIATSARGVHAEMNVLFQGPEVRYIAGSIVESPSDGIENVLFIHPSESGPQTERIFLSAQPSSSGKSCSVCKILYNEAAAILRNNPRRTPSNLGPSKIIANAAPTIKRRVGRYMLGNNKCDKIAADVVAHLRIHGVIGKVQACSSIGYCQSNP